MSSKGNVFLLIGQSKLEPLVYVEFTTTELKKYQVNHLLNITENIFLDPLFSCVCYIQFSNTPY